VTNQIEEPTPTTINNKTIMKVLILIIRDDVMLTWQVA